MHKPSSAIESTEPRAASARPHPLFILPPFTPPRRSGLTLLVLADGNRRCSAGGGYAGGARRVVSIAEHLASRPDVEVMVACILSPDNVAKRGDGFFFELYKQFVDLGFAIETRGALVTTGVRIEVWGDLGSLRARGGRAVDLADAVEAVAGMTAHVVAPRLRLILGVGYGRDTVRELDVDIVLRTGMEEPGVLRLSGLHTGASVANCAIATLWPDVEPRDVDDLIELCKQRASPRFAVGHDLSVIVELAVALSTAEADPPVRATIPTSARPAAVAAALASLFEGRLRGCTTLAIEHSANEDAAPERHGPGPDARHVLRVVGGSPPGYLAGEGELCSVLAPGQTPPVFVLPDGLALGHANVHACAPTAEGIMEAIRAAQRFSAAHPPLFGCDRTNASVAPGAPEVVTPRPAASERDVLGERFVEKTLAWAGSAGLLLPGTAWRTAAENYALTAFFIHLRIPTEWDEPGASWEERADLAARYMLLVAAGDEGVFDRVIEGETPERRWARLEVSARFLGGALHSEAARPRLPRVPGADLMAAIAEQWRELFDRYHRSCVPAAAASFRAGLESLYAASLAEHRAGITSFVLARPGEPRASREAGAAAIEERLAAMPPVVAARARALLDGAMDGDLPSANELRTLVYLAETAGAIGAGLLFRSAALAAPAPCITGPSIALLDAAAALLDYHFRLSNDLSGLLDSPSGDRDPKKNACTVLVPESASGAARVVAIVQALATCRRLAAWLDGEVVAAIERVAAAWPSMGVILRRGAFVGRRVYELGHYTKLSRAQMRRILDEASAR